MASIRFRTDTNLALDWYLAGPMSGRPNFGYDRFGAIYQYLTNEAVHVRAPHLVEGCPKDIEGDKMWQWYMKRTVEMMLKCQGVIAMHDYLESRGARIEVRLAVELGMPVYLLDADDKLPTDPSQVSA